MQGGGGGGWPKLLTSSPGLNGNIDTSRHDSYSMMMKFSVADIQQNHGKRHGTKFMLVHLDIIYLNL